MKKYIFLLIRNMLIFFILVCTISCEGKKDTKNAGNIQNNKSLITERTEDLDSGYDWVLNTELFKSRQGDEKNDYQIDIINLSTSKSINDVFSNYNLRMDNSLIRYLDEGGNFIGGRGVVPKNFHYLKIPTPSMYTDWSLITFLASFGTLEYNSHDSVIYLLVFYEKDGIVREFDWTRIGYGLEDLCIINSAHNIEYYFINDIPGTRIGNSSAIVYNFNDDGYEDIMLFHMDSEPLSNIRVCSIFNYTNEAKIGIGYKQVFSAPIYIFLPQSTKTWDYGPPVQFGTYKGEKGFIICEETPTGEIAKQYIGPESLGYELLPVYKGIWNFYSWDKEEKKYIFIDRVNPDEIKTQWAKIIRNREKFKN